MADRDGTKRTSRTRAWRRASQNDRERPRAGGLAATIGVFVGLSLLLRLPDLLSGAVPTDPARYLERPERIYYLLSFDLFTLLTLLAAVPRTVDGSRVRAFVTGSILFLLAYRTYDAAVLATLDRSPIFYADVSHVVGAAYLLVNAPLSRGTLVGIGAGVVLLGVFAWLLPAGVRRLHRRARTSAGRRWIVIANVVMWPVVLFAGLTDRGYYLRRETYQSVCLSTTECLVRNVKASWTLQQDVSERLQSPVDSTYVQYRALDWQRPPSIYFIMVESYGSVLSTSSDLSSSSASSTSRRSPAYDRFMEQVGDSLRADGWHAATAQSIAPVFGGRSWLSAATVFLGSPLQNQAVFEAMRPRIPRHPHLIDFLQRQGYETATLQPPVRKRSGLEVRNQYGFDHTFYLEDLNYRGPEMGWGLVPDQYSLSVAHEEFIERVDAPFFLFFETVTPHAPWHTPPPPLAEDPARLGRPQATGGSASTPAGRQGGASQSAWPGGLSQAERLFRLIRYDWRVLVKYLRAKAPPNSLFVVVGDHQPYFANGESQATPLHVLSRDAPLIRRFEGQGFASGLRPSAAADTLHHAGLYPLLVRTLTAHDRAATGDASAALPPHRPHGVERAALLPNRP